MPDDCTNLRVSKPVTLGRGGEGILLCSCVSRGQEEEFYAKATYTGPIAVASPYDYCPGTHMMGNEL